MAQIIVAVGEVSRDQYQPIRKQLFRVCLRQTTLLRCDLATWRRAITDRVIDTAKVTTFEDRQEMKEAIDNIWRDALGVNFSDVVAVIINPSSRFHAIEEEPYLPGEEQEEEEEVEWRDEEIVELYCYLFGKSVVCRTITREN
jgi:hypothetical protein